jgi:pilus assembly protein CpaB
MKQIQNLEETEVKKVKILALLAAIVTALLIFVFLSTLINVGDGKGVNIVSAAQDISANTVITEEMLVMVEIPEGIVLPGALTKISDAVGQTSLTDIIVGEQIVAAKLVLPGETATNTLAYAIEPGNRAITIGVDNVSGLAGMIHPGDRIDLLAELDVEGVTNTELVAENIKVLAVDAVLDKSGKVATGEVAAYATITLEVTTIQAMEVSFAANSGPMRAIMRSPMDQEIKAYRSVTLATLII